METTRITIEVYQSKSGAVDAGRAAVAAVRALGSVMHASAVYHPGEEDETTVDLLTAPATRTAPPRAPAEPPASPEPRAPETV